MKKIGVVGVIGGWSSEQLADAVERKTGYRLLIDMQEVVLDLASGRAVYQGVDLGSLDALIIKKIAPSYSPDVLDRLEILRFLEGRGLPIFSRPSSILRLIDRLSCTVSLRLADVPMPETVVTESVAQAAAALARFGKAVFKPLYTSKARGMTVIESGPHAAEAIAAYQARGNATIYMQKMLPSLGRDLGVTFLGGEYLATYARLGSGQSWNTTTRTGGKYAPYTLTDEILELAQRAQAPFGMDFTCVDVAETDQGPMVFEVSAFGGFRGLLDAHGLDIASTYVDYVLKRI